MNYTIKKIITSWEKSIFYFSYIETKYENVWFKEDDVFFNDENIFLKFDLEYINCDLLTSKIYEKKYTLS